VLSAVILLCCPAVSGCLYAVAAKAALATASGVARAVSQPTTEGEAPLPQDRNALLDAYKDCIRRKTPTPTVDCSRYRHALE
jgi:hypothetical protein